MQRRAIELHGIVQSVGFRPFVHRLATDLGLGGFVQNQAGSLRIEVEGESGSLDRFCTELTEHAPALARVESLSWQFQAALGESRFQIKPSDSHTSGQVFICPDVSICGDCRSELFDPRNRRYRYPFINCTNCGPRLTIVTGAPYDRHRTTMAAFEMCSQCRAEYADPTDRRYHAEAIACPDCGPRLSLYLTGGVQVDTTDPLQRFVRILKEGKIGALKGLGGYHLACDARSEQAVARLRLRKSRDEKPLAIMVRDLHAARRLCDIGTLEQNLLCSPQAPIVLLRKHAVPGDAQIAEAVAPGNPHLGLMLPYTPLHHLLLEASHPMPLVMTSGNAADDPIAYRDEEAMCRLQNVADIFLVHDRAIHVRCDDSVTRIVSGAELPIRRSRGYAPQPIHLPHPCGCPILAVGGQLKGTFALGRDSQAFVSHHLGDLDQLEAFRAFQNDIALYKKLFEIEPMAVAHDLHPDYASTRYAQSCGLPRVPVQHHHAHMASCLAENRVSETAIGITFDGAGLGTDGAIWGGEFLVGDCSQFHRMAHLKYVGMPGGEQAMREPWRMAIAHLLDANVDSCLLESIAAPNLIRTLDRMLERQWNSPRTSSMGRLFDAVAAISGVRQKTSYEGQAAAELEWLATNSSLDGVYDWEIVEGNRLPALEIPVSETPVLGMDLSQLPTWLVDARPLIRGVAADVRSGISRQTIARRFHTSVVELIAKMSCKIRETTGLTNVVLSGGVFMNALLTSESQQRLHDEGFAVYCHHHVPANDGGLSLGQLAIACQRLGERITK